MAVPTAPRYATTDEMRERANVTSSRDEDLMTAAILAAEIAIDTYCGRSFEVLTPDVAPRYFRARSFRYVRIDDAIAITTVEIGAGTQADTFTTFTGEYVALTCNGGAVHMLEADSQHWPHPRGWVKVTPTTSWGWSAVPGNVAEATRMQALKTFKRKDAPEGIMGFEGAGVVKISKGLDVDVATLLSGWRRREMVSP